MGLLEEILKNKEEILISLLKILEGKEASAAVNLDGVEITVGNTTVRLSGEIKFKVNPNE